MSRTETIRVPDIGDFTDVDIIEVLVSPGDTIEEGDALITLESEKSSLEVPAPRGGRVATLHVEQGDQVSEGDPILDLEIDEEQATGPTGEEEASEAGEAEAGDDAAAETASGEGEAEAASEKAGGGTDETGESGEDGDAGKRAAPAGAKVSRQAPETVRPQDVERESSDSHGVGGEEAPLKPRSDIPDPPLVRQVDGDPRDHPHASPSVRRFARELGVDLREVEGSGRVGRVVEGDIKRWVRERLKEKGEATSPKAPPSDRPEEPPASAGVDFSRFGPVEEVPLHRIQRYTARNVHRSWREVPHVTHHDEADVTDLEAWRAELDPQAREQGYKLSPLAFVVAATARALRRFPRFNTSLHPSGESLIQKDYVHVGVAVDTDDGLVVPVIRDADRKGVMALAQELAEVSERMRAGKSRPSDFEGGTFTVSSLGGIGGTAFTPIVNAPEVAILGVSRMAWRQVMTDGAFEPRRMLPLSLSYDHRVIDGAAAARFTAWLAHALRDVRRLLL